MAVSQVLAFATGAAIALYFLVFAVSSFRERQPRAPWLSIGAAVIPMTLSIGATHFVPVPDGVLLAATGIVWLALLLYFLPLKTPSPMNLDTVTERIDERDTMFAREEYRSGSKQYEQYYDEHPHLKEFDDRLRELPELLGPGGRFYDPLRASQIRAVFEVIRALTTHVDGAVSDRRIDVIPERLTAEIKRLVLRLGAAEAGVARLNKMFVYSHVGRGPEPWGRPIELSHRYAIVFALEMDYGRVQRAPDLPITEESALQYLRAANISISLARYLRSLGYPARAHISDSNYQIMLPPVAQDAGLGELSRMGYLLSRRFGPRVRLGAVTTDVPLVPDAPMAFGVQDFCARCFKCAVNCPSSAIPRGDPTIIRGVRKWQLDIERCLWYWRVAGTDCGLCMKVCPYGHPPTFVHNVVRRAAGRSAFAQRISIWGDDLFYGRFAGRHFS